jgi:hypothetical protein
VRNGCISIKSIVGNGVLKTYTFHFKTSTSDEILLVFSYQHSLRSVSVFFLNPDSISSEPFIYHILEILDLKLNVLSHFRTFSVTRNKIQTLHLKKRSKSSTIQHMQSCQRLRSSLFASAPARANSTVQESSYQHGSIK